MRVSLTPLFQHSGLGGVVVKITLIEETPRKNKEKVPIGTIVVVSCVNVFVHFCARGSRAEL
jgi:hypothetical protein